MRVRAVERIERGRVVAAQREQKALGEVAVNLHEVVVVGCVAVHDEEVEGLVLLELRSLTEVGGVLDGEGVEIEGLVEDFEVAVRRSLQIEPEEPAGEALLQTLTVEDSLFDRSVSIDDAAAHRAPDPTGRAVFPPEAGAGATRLPSPQSGRAASLQLAALGLDYAAVAEERMRLEVRPREITGSRESRRLRKQGLIPGVLYGRGHDPRVISIPERELRRVLTGAHGLHAILDVVLEGERTTHPSILKEYQRDPVRGALAHVDLLEVRLDRPIQAQVVVELVGEPEGVKEGGVLSQVTREITVEALPMDVPDRIELDVSGMAMGDTLRLADLARQDGVTFLDDPEETVLATVTLPTRVVEPEEMVEEEEEGVEAIPPEERPEGAAEAPVEPGAPGDAGPRGEPGTAPG